MAEPFKLPGSSYDEIVKIIKAYSVAKEGTVQTLDAIAQSTKMDRTSVSANNGFLVQMGVITEGNKKGTTEIGRLLGRAYTSKIEEEVARIWCELVNENDFVSRMISAVRIRDGMDKQEFLNHILYSSGQTANSRNRVGAGALVEILKASKLIWENDGKIDINLVPSIEDPSGECDFRAVNPTSYQVSTALSKTAGSITINLNLDVACTADSIDGLADKIKKFMKEMADE